MRKSLLRNKFLTDKARVNEQVSMYTNKIMRQHIEATVALLRAKYGIYKSYSENYKRYQNNANYNSL